MCEGLAWRSTAGRAHWHGARRLERGARGLGRLQGLRLHGREGMEEEQDPWLNGSMDLEGGRSGLQEDAVGWMDRWNSVGIGWC